MAGWVLMGAKISCLPRSAKSEPSALKADAPLAEVFVGGFGHEVLDDVDLVALSPGLDPRVGVAAEARRRGYDGVVCGHIHHAEIRDVDGTLYCNDGDWVESRSALVEHHDGRLELVFWQAGHGAEVMSQRAVETV